MSENQPPKPKADDLAKDLKASLAQRRPRTWLPTIVAVVVASLVLGGVYIWMQPRRRAQPLQVLALDAVFTPDQTPVARAQLFEPIGDTARSRLGGQTIVLFEQMAANPRRIVAKSDAAGSAQVDWPLDGAPAAEFFAQFIDDERRQVSSAVRGRLFIWPKDTPLLIVDAHETLITGDLNADALSRLTKAHEEGWRVIYLAVKSATAPDFAAAHAWLDDKAKLPRGPVLGRGIFPSDAPMETAWRDALTSLKTQFTGPMLAVVGSDEAAQTCKEANVPTVRIGADNGGVPWADVPVRLKD